MANPVQINDATWTDAVGGVGVVSAMEARNAIASHVAHDGAGTRTGVFYEGNQAILSGTATTSPNMTVQVAPLAWCGSKSGTEGVYVGRSTSTVTVDVAAAPASNSRIDAVYVMQRDSNATISPDSNTQGEIGVITGQAGLNPNTPAIPTGAVLIGTVTVAAGATATNGSGVTVTTSCQWTTGAGSPIPVRNASDQSALTAFDGLASWRLDTHKTEIYAADAGMWAPKASSLNGAGWGSYTTSPYGGTNVRRSPDGDCQMRGVIYRTDPTYTTTAGTWYTIGFVPSWAQPTDYAVQYTSCLNSGAPIQIRVNTGGGSIQFQTFTAQTITQNQTSFPIDGSWWRAS